MPLILLHAIGMDAGSWSFTEIPDAEPLDMAGFGDQPLPEGGLSHAGMADDIAARTSGPLDIVGVSMGGQIAMHLGLRHPDRVRSLVLANTGPAVDPAMMQQRADTVRSQGMSADVIQGTLDRWFTEPGLAADAEPIRYARSRLQRDDPLAFEAGWRSISGHNVKDRLGELAMPITVIAGRQDKAASLEQVQAMAEALPNSRLVILEGPHMVYMEFGDEFAGAVRGHMEWVRTSTGGG